MKSGRDLPSREALAQITMLVMDVDGVLTDGRIYFDGEGREYKTFHVHDGAGIAYWHRAGGLTAFISGRGGPAVEGRAEELGIHELHLRTHHKSDALDAILAARDVRVEHVAYIGDDLLDLPVLERVGFACTVPEGRPAVRAAAHMVTHSRAGFGAARDVIEVLLQARGVWDDVVAKGGLP